MKEQKMKSIKDEREQRNEAVTYKRKWKKWKIIRQ